MALEENTNNEQAAQDLFTRTNLTPEPISTNAQKMAGTPKTGANPKPAGMSYMDQKVSRLNGMMLDMYKPDENKYNKLTTYNSSHYGQNFERYYAHGKFKQLGFSPFRNNEEFYNNNSSLWHDAARGGKTALRLAGLGFSSTFTNWGSFLSDKPNTEEADEMERLMSIGSSSREGFGAKAINFGVNAGYTYGVMTEILAEEVALFFAGTLGAIPSGGAATVGALARTGTNIGRAWKALKLLTKVDDARQAWRIAKTAGKGLRELAPLSQTTSLLTKTGRAAAKWDSLDNMAKASKAFGTFYRDLREINAVTSEAKMEGGTAKNNVANTLMAQFRKDNGREPTLAEAQGIAAQANKAGYLASQTNMAGIYVSNKIVLDRALKGIPGLKSLEKAASKSKATFIFNKDWKKLGIDPHSMLKGASKFTKRAYYKHVFNPKNLGRGGLNYLSANLMEGTQEVYQEAVGKGITDYFVNTYNNPNLAGSGYFRTMMESGLKSQASAQGLETFLSGFLMAGPMTMTQSAFYKGYDAVRMKKLKNQAQKFTADPANAGKENPYQTQIDREIEFDQRTLESMNEVTKDPVAYFNALEKDLKIQKDLAMAGEQAALDGDVKFARDTRDASLVGHSIQLLNAGRFDIFQDQLKGLRDLSKEELQEAFGEDPAAEKGTIQERLEKVIARTNEIKDVYEEYENTINPHSLRDQPEEYLAFEQMRNVMISNDIHFKFVAGRMESIYNDFANTLPFKNANVTDFAPLFSIGSPSSEAPILRPGMRAEVEMLSKEIEALGDRPENAAKKEQLTKKKQSLEALSGLSQLYLAQYLNTQKVSQNEQSFQENSEVLDETEKLFKDSFFSHIKLLAEQNGQVILDKDIEKTYQSYKDYWKLSGDRAEYANAINAFANPQMFAQMQGRMTAAMKAAMAVRKEKLKDSLAEYKKKYLTNNFLNDLFEKFNVFVDPDEAQAFLDDKEIPSTFYNADTLEEIELGSEEYKGIMALVDEYDEAYFEETGKHYIKNAEGTLQSFRDKLKDDVRTVNELGKEFAFDPTSQTTQVDARQVLQAVMNSKFADKDLKKLAQILSGMVQPGTQVTFKMDHHTNSTFDEQNGIIVDPRFSSEGYNIGVVPIEFSIMNAMMQKVVSESLQTDSVFNDAITKLREKLVADTKDPVEKKLLGLALGSNEGFVAEVMTSPLLQQKLESLPFTDNLTEQTEEAKTLWDTFIDQIKSLLRRVFGDKRSPSVYDEAVIVITNKLSQPGVAPNITAEETEVAEEVTTEEEPALEELLKEGFQQALSELDPSERLGMSYESWKLTSPLAADIRKKYQAEKVKQTVAKQGAAAVPALTEEERKRLITDLGYTVAEMNSMGEAEIEEIIKEKRKKKITLRRKSGDVEIEFDEFLPAEAIVENAIRDLRLKLEKANYKVFELKDDKGKVIDSWYARADKDGNEIQGTRHERVSNVVKDKGDFAPGAADRGTVIDELLRDYLNSEITNIVDFKTKYNSLRQQYPSAIFSDAMLNELFDSFRTVQRQIKSLGLRVDARMPALYGVLGPKFGTTDNPVNVAGSIDVLAFNSLGEVFIIDLKTSTQDRRLQYKAEEALENMFGAEWPGVKDTINKSENNIDAVIDGKRVSPEQLEKLKEFRNNPQFQELDGKYGFKVYFYKSDDEAQQNAYRELLKQVSGIDVKNIVIFPLKVTKTSKTFTSVNFQLDGKGKYTMYVKGPGSTDIYDITGRENVITDYPENPISEEKLNELIGPESETTTDTPPSTSEVDIVNTPSQSIIDELNKLGSVNEKLEWLKNNNLITPITIGGKSYNTIDYSDRVMVLMKIGKYNIPFYISTGQAGKKDVKAGDWYAVFGIGEEGWINKGSTEQINKQYENPVFQKFARILNEGVGKIISRDDTDKIKEGIGFLDDTPEVIREFNAQMNLPTEPAPNRRSPEIFYAHVNSTLGLVYDEIKALKREPVSEPPVDRAAEIKRKIEALEDKIKTLYRFKSDTDSNAAVVQAEKDIAKYEEQLKKLQEELAVLEKQPTEKTTEQTIADLRAREQVELRKAIPNIDDYPDTYGEKQGNMPGVLYGIYKVIYDKYDKLITDASGTKTTEETTKESTGATGEMVSKRLQEIANEPVLINIATEPIYEADPKQQSTLFRIFEKAFYEGWSPRREGDIKRLDDITDAQLALIKPETRKYLVGLSDYLSQFDTGFNYANLKTDDAKIKHVSSRFFGGAGRGGMLGQPGRLEFPEMVLPIPSANVVANINEAFGAKLEKNELDVSNAKGSKQTGITLKETSNEIISKIKAELSAIGLPYSDVVSNDKGSTYYVVTKDGEKIEILKLMAIGGALAPTYLTKGEWINHLIETQPEDLFAFVNNELAAKAETQTQPVEETTEEPVATNNVPEKFDVTKALEEVLNENPELAAIGTAQQYADYLTSVFPETVLKNIFYRGTPDPNIIEAEDIDPTKGTGAKNLGIGIYWTPNKKKGADYTGGGKGRILAAILNVKNFHITNIDSNWQRGYDTPNTLTVSEITNGADSLLSYKGLDRDDHVEFKTNLTNNVHVGKYVGPVDEYGLPGYQKVNNETPQFDQLAVNSNEQVHILGSKKDLQGFKDFVSKRSTGTQTQMEFEDLAFNVGDTVKVNTPKNGEGVIAEDRGDKVLLEDGRQIMKKNLTKLTSTSTEAPKSIVTPELQGKVIYVSPSKESTTKLFDMPGVIYGNIIYAKVVAGEFTDELVEKLRELAESDITDEFSSAAETIVNVIDNGLTPDKVKAFNYSISVIRTAKGNRVPVGLSSTLRYVMTNLVWTKTMAQARELAKQGLTVVFDNNEAASSNQVDIAFVSDTTDLIDDYTETGKDNYKKAVGVISPTKVIPTPSGKGIVDILQGKATSGVQVSKAMVDLKNSIFTADKSELKSINTELKSLRSIGALDPILQKQNITEDQVREALAKRKELLKDVLEMNEISVGDIVQVSENFKKFPGMVIAKTEDGITIAKIILNENGGPTQSKDDLFNSKEISTFTAKQVPYSISPMAKEEAPVIPDPDVKAQSDAATEEVKSTPTEVSQRLKDNMENTKNQSVEDTVNDFLEGLCTGKKGKKQ